MNTATVSGQDKKCFIILGPDMVRGRLVLNAMSALYYLPKYFRLVFVGNPKDQSFYNELVNIVDSFNLDGRIRFMYELDKPDAIVTDRSGNNPKAAWGNTPEALASAILRVSR